MRPKCTLCSEPNVAQGLCNKHYIAWSKYGDPERKLNARNEPFQSRYAADQITECWVWNVKNPLQRYGWWKAHGEIKAHRASWVMHHGVIPPGMQVLHRCDCPRCVNPKHLFLGTQVANMEDMRTKGRARASAGNQNTNAKLNETQVRLIRQDTRSLEQISEAFGVHKETVRRIKMKKLWPHLL